MHSEELHKLYASSNVKAINSKRERLARHVARMAEMRNSCKIWSENLKGSALRGLMRRWEDNIRMDLREVGWEVVDWIDLAQGWDQWRDFVNMVMNFRVQ